MRIDPIKDSKVEYIYVSHPKPYTINHGIIKDVKLEDGALRVDFDLVPSRKVFLQVLDADKRVVVEAWCPAGVKHGTIGVREQT